MNIEVKTKIWRIVYVEDEVVYYTQPIVEAETISEIYRDFDRLAVKDGLEFWVESAEVVWNKEG